MALADRRVLCQRLVELYKDDQNVLVKLLVILSRLPDAEVTKIWNTREVLVLVDSQVIEKRFLEKVLLAGPSLGSMMTGLADELVDKLPGTLPSLVNMAVNSQVKNLEAMLPIKKIVFRLAFKPKSRSSNSSAIRPAALQYYTDSTAPTTIVCAVSGQRLPACDVHVGHIYQRWWLPPRDPNYFKIDDPWNILLMHKNVKKKLQNLEITVLPVHHKVILLRKDLEDKVAFEYTKDDGVAAAGDSDGGTCGSTSTKVAITWGELHDKPLSVHGVNQPSDTALGVHARAAYRYAMGHGWCSKSQRAAILDHGGSEMLHRYLAEITSLDGELTIDSSIDWGGSSGEGASVDPAT
ncbi:hypothetical protein Vafri_10884 [Volvox africanus]|uniref:Uncharacterized protein n=1 Tax=Volvox africanus TaxID=51714 RepID=A0A8J4B781_9CHLO|nr:hypothetical protein Vafri_10884 [Volvox africanus]